MKNKYNVNYSKVKNLKEFFKNLILDFLNNPFLFLFSLVLIASIIYLTIILSDNYFSKTTEYFNDEINYSKNFKNINNLELKLYERNKSYKYMISSPFSEANYEDIAHRIKTFYGSSYDIEALNSLKEKKIIAEIEESDFKDYFFINDSIIVLKVIENGTIQPKAYVNYCPVNGSKILTYDGNFIIDIISNHKYSPLTGKGLTTGSSLMKLIAEKVETN